MENSDIKNDFENGLINIADKVVKAEDLVWNNHPAYKGVALKHLITGKDTSNKFSCHFVKVEPGCEIGLHIHEGKTELHEIIAGSGFGYIEEKQFVYKPGIITLIPADKEHHVKAGENGLFIFAKFFPALV